MEKFVVRGRNSYKSRVFHEGFLRVGAFNYFIQDRDSGKKTKVFKESLEKMAPKLDRKGNKLFEGDIIVSNGEFGLVWFDEPYAKFRIDFWMKGKQKDFEKVLFDEVSKVGDRVNDKSWLNFKGPIFVDFDEVYDFLEKKKAESKDPTRLVVITKGTLNHPRFKNRNVYIYDLNENKILAYMTFKNFAILNDRGLVTQPTSESKYKSVHIYIGKPLIRKGE